MRTGIPTSAAAEQKGVIVGELSPWHWAIVILIAVLLFGSRRLPDAARSLGRSARILKAELREGAATPPTEPPQAEPPRAELRGGTGAASTSAARPEPHDVPSPYRGPRSTDAQEPEPRSAADEHS